MRTAVRRAMAGAIGLLFGLLATGCGGPAGIDGSLTDDWPAIGAAQAFQPVNHACYDGPPDLTVLFYSDLATPCTSPHSSETFVIGKFEGADAATSVPPAAFSPAANAAFAKCSAQAPAFLGGDYRAKLVRVRLVLPSPHAWTGGGRWYRCDVFQVPGPFEDEFPPTRITGSLAGRLAGSDLDLTCVDGQMTQWGYLYYFRQVDCSVSHIAEFVGVYEAPLQVYPEFHPQGDDPQWDVAKGACNALVAKYLGSTDGYIHNSKIGLWFTGFNRLQWELGDRSTQCFAYAGTASGKMTGSVKGIGSKSPHS